MARKPNDEQTFWRHVQQTDGCWLWTGRKLKAGYGLFMMNYRDWLTHRLSFTLSFGAIPEGMNVLHRCDTPSCVRPDHLFLGTQQENMDDMKAKQRSPKGRSFPERLSSTKLTDEDVREIRTLSQSMPAERIASMFDVHPVTIRRIKHSKSRRNVI